MMGWSVQRRQNCPRDEIMDSNTGTAAELYSVYLIFFRPLVR
jgi:hypothetical protein